MEGTMNELTEQQIATIKDASRKLTGVKRRAFQAQVAVDMSGGVRAEQNPCLGGLAKPWSWD
jgi:hypothetical protein